MLELSTLGLLQRESLHGYRLKQKLELFMSSCISVNYGAIYPLLKRLEERGEVVAIAEEAGDAGATRKIYGITPKGRERWREKMLEYPQESWVNSRTRFSIKFFFFGDLEPAERIKLLQQRLRVCQLQQDELNSRRLEYTLTDPYQKAAWERGQDILRSEVQWLIEQLAKEELKVSSNLSSNWNSTAEIETPVNSPNQVSSQ